MNKCSICHMNIAMIKIEICRDCFESLHTLCTACCWGDHCDKPSHFYRPNCPECKGLGWFANNEPCGCATRAHKVREVQPA